VRVRDHVALSTATAAVLYPRLRASVLSPWAASIFIDVDHYLWFSLRHHRLNPVAAVRFFNEAQPPQHTGTRPFHQPGVLLLLLVLGVRRRAVMRLLLGMTFHVGLDVFHRARTAEARAAVLRRDHFTCRVCGAEGPDVVAHLWRQPRLLPSYRRQHYVSVCASCHEAAHADRVGAVAAVDCNWNSYLQRTGLSARVDEARVAQEFDDIA
jgi:hypothetical protein